MEHLEWSLNLKVLYVSFLLEETLMWFNLYLKFHPFVDSRVEDSEYVNLEADFFPKIGAL
ncbi:unnamed protein product [Spirodela intermedia]|uniref:Uncharacterized protein n=1 Tax=Spirodela intermedia TaxID=51605 RepID=A0A7I8JXN4_SPIIN|nr:unnamed protein product [Spirodela intermedia]